ncbi:MAG TPA: PQQ-binding-like beta-propeller repeat protein [Bryobacteraceae bacterium]|nr:PQQ-binding-like beta-propeller repeat protein [Bryobacteraceae bacterium]
MHRCCRSIAALILLSAPASAAGETYREWRVVGGADNIHYSSLDQINRSNVRDLEIAWRFDSHDEYEGSEMQCNPIVIDGVLYATTPRLRVIALDAATGRLIWDFDPRRGEPVRGKQRNRGLNYWSDGNDARIFVGIDRYLYALNARDGRPVAAFGDNGRIDLSKGLGRDGERLMVRLTSPGVIYKDLLILGSLVAEDLPSAPGHIRAFDVRTGRLRWEFHTIPQPGEFGYETWPQDAWKYAGGANSWAGLTLDVKRGLVFVPTGSAAFDFYGSNRIGDNLFANCVLALKAETGERVWHFQGVRHDLWDRDFPAAPALVTVRRGGRAVDAVAQITKSGFVWLLNRDTGELLYPARTIAAPPSPVDGEVAASSQVLPTAPAPFARQELTRDMLTNRTPEAHAAVLQQFLKLRSGPQFTPPSFEGTIVFPGFDGGAEWGGAAWDPQSGLLYVNANEMAWILRLVPRRAANAGASGRGLYMQNCSGCHRPDLRGTPPEFPSLLAAREKLKPAQIEKVVRNGAGRMPGFAQLGHAKINAIVQFIATGEDVKVAGPEVRSENAAAPLKYGIDGYNKFLDPDGYPAIQPPWGTLNAINLNTAEYAWKIPFGEIPELVAKGLRNTGSENYGGGVVTAGGLLFIGATDHDRKFHAFDKTTGQLLWETVLPAAGNATPAVYQVAGREYVVIAAGGGKWGQPSGGSYIAFALKRAGGARLP